MPPLPLLAACALLGLVMFAQVPGQDPVAAELTNAAHGPAFALLALLLFRIIRAGPVARTPLLVQYATVICSAMALGATVELLQGMLGRDASWDDLVRDALGTLTATGWLLMRDPRLRGQELARNTRLAGACLATFGAVMIAWPPVVSALAHRDRDSHFPVLADFGRYSSLHFVHPLGDAKVQWAPVPPKFAANLGQIRALRVETTSRRWWGVMLRELAPDWRPYQQLCVTVANPGPQSLALELRLHDRASLENAAASVNHLLEVPPASWRTVRLRLSAMKASRDGEPFDLAQIQSLMLTRKGPMRNATEFYVTRVWLE